MEQLLKLVSVVTVGLILLLSVGGATAHEEKDIDIIKRLSKTGKLCAEIGHIWEYPIQTNLVYCPDGCPSNRYCSVCGISQISDSRWKYLGR